MRHDSARPLRGPLRAVALTLVCILGAPAFSQPQAPAPAQTGGATATIDVDRNVYRAGGQVRPSGPVQGDFVAAGGRVIVDQAVSGDAALVGGSVDVRAPVGDDVRAAGGDVNVESAVGGELFASGGNVTVTNAASVSGGARLYGADVTVDGRIDGRLKAAAQRIVINGEVRGDARLVAEQIELGPAAKIGGALSYSSRSELKKAEGAVISGAVTREEGAPERERPAPGPPGQGATWAGSVFMFVATLASAAVFLALMPRLAAGSADRVRTSPWLSLAFGFVIVMVVPMLAVLLFITILGIPLGLLVMALYPALWLLGFLVGAIFIARLIPALMKKPPPGTFGATMGYVALTLFVLVLVARVPGLGGLLMGLLTLVGMGAGVLEVYSRTRRRGAPPAPPATAPVTSRPDEEKGWARPNLP